MLCREFEELEGNELELVRFCTILTGVITTEPTPEVEPCGLLNDDDEGKGAFVEKGLCDRFDCLVGVVEDEEACGFKIGEGVVLIKDCCAWISAKEVLLAEAVGLQECEVVAGEGDEDVIGTLLLIRLDCLDLSADPGIEFDVDGIGDLLLSVAIILLKSSGVL